MKIILTVLILFVSYAGFSQSQNNKNNPKKDIKVNRKYDKNGNLIRYDSTYVYTWSSDSLHQFMPDSTFFNSDKIRAMQKQLMESMKHFHKNDSVQKSPFDDPFFSDDFFQHDFMPKDFGNDQFFEDIFRMMKQRRELQKEYWEKFHHNTDSIRKRLWERQKQFFKQRDSLNKEKNRLKNAVTI
jgi:hypothetical protein